MKTHFFGIAIIAAILFWMNGTAYASWGWESTNDPIPFYHQDWGKWYNYDDAQVFMVQIEDKTSKYVFDYNGQFIGGWSTYMPMRLK